jgi:hypothetical protein
MFLLGEEMSGDREPFTSFFISERRVRGFREGGIGSPAREE